MYVDVGTNIGTQIRKLFEPDKYESAGLEAIFAKFFGRDLAERRRTVCTVGWEPNPAHAQWLTSLAGRYNELGWRTHMMLGTAASTDDGETSFYVDQTEQGKRHHEWSASVHKTALNQGSKASAKSVTVRTVDLARWLRRELPHRKLPHPRSSQFSSTASPHVVMKLDIEGAEFALIPHLMDSGVICEAIDHLFGEFHTKTMFRSVPKFNENLEAEVQRQLNTLRPACKTVMTQIDEDPFCSQKQIDKGLRRCRGEPPLPATTNSSTT